MECCTVQTGIISIRIDSTQSGTGQSDCTLDKAVESLAFLYQERQTNLLYEEPFVLPRALFTFSDDIAEKACDVLTNDIHRHFINSNPQIPESIVAMCKKV